MTTSFTVCTFTQNFIQTCDCGSCVPQEVELPTKKTEVKEVKKVWKCGYCGTDFAPEAACWDWCGGR